MKAIFVVLAILAVAGTGLQAGAISDESFFDSIDPDHTYIGFEVDAYGNPVIVPEWGDPVPLYYDDYSTYGFELDKDISYTNPVSGTNFETAQSIGGSLQNAIPAPGENEFAILFTVPVRAFGFWVVNNNTASEGMTFVAKNASGNVIEEVSLEGALIDGTVGVADYGFMGIWADEDIARVDITKEAAILDDFRFSELPEPASLVLLALGGLTVLRRRARG